MPIIHHLYTSPGHNFFGHHGEAAGQHPIIEHERIELLADRGIAGDRFLDFKDGYKGQITFIHQEAVEAVRSFLSKPGLPAWSFRRNVVIEGLDLNALVGKRFRLGELLFEGTEECSPCYWMDEACGTPGTEAFLKGNGGLRCRILESGTLVRGQIGFGAIP